MAKQKEDLLKGTLDLLILKTLELEPMHGWGIAERIEMFSDEVLRVPTGSLYPALQRLLRKGFIVAEWRTSENKRRARYYRLASIGHKQLKAETESWNRTSMAVNQVLRASL